MTVSRVEGRIRLKVQQVTEPTLELCLLSTRFCVRSAIFARGHVRSCRSCNRGLEIDTVIVSRIGPRPPSRVPPP